MHAINWVAEKNRWPHLSAVHFQPLGRRPIIDMLIGLDLSDLHCSLKEIKGCPGEPIARLMEPIARDGQASDHFRRTLDLLSIRCRSLLVTKDNCML